MYSPRGLLHLAHSVSDMREITRRAHSNYVNGVDAELLSPQAVREHVPFINLNGRYPVLGAILQRRGGIARHDAVAWGYARAADSLGVDIIQNCEVTGFQIQDGVIAKVETTRGVIGVAKRVGAVTAGNSGVLGGNGRFSPADRNSAVAGLGIGTFGANSELHRDV